MLHGLKLENKAFLKYVYVITHWIQALEFCGWLKI